MNIFVFNVFLLLLKLEIILYCELLVLIYEINKYFPTSLNFYDRE